MRPSSDRPCYNGSYVAYAADSGPITNGNAFMFERYTDRARKAITLADQEARRLKHEYIGTEHLLLGIVLEGTGLGASILSGFGIDLERLRAEIEALIRTGPDPVTLKKLPYTPRAKEAIAIAKQEARRFKHNYLGQEHLLLGLSANPDALSAIVLAKLDVTPEVLRHDVAKILGLPHAA